MQFMWERYAPGGDTGRHALAHEGEECGFVIRSERAVTVAGRDRVLKAGKPIILKAINRICSKVMA